MEHIVHKLHIRCVEVSEVKRGESGAAMEHFAHIRHLRCIQIFKV